MSKEEWFKEDISSLDKVHYCGGTVGECRCRKHRQAGPTFPPDCTAADREYLTSIWEEGHLACMSRIVYWLRGLPRTDVLEAAQDIEDGAPWNE